ncbi:unnamed protein product [Paramecium sonneborni]|uniref:Uncharacterized protein n=1 Tax=Paramecium sonneborni TaxID=65129 RepID=A0A8S1PVV5_9CILI|nr:unnamed protein product [Paramecium sonneborni]
MLDQVELTEENNQLIAKIIRQNLRQMEFWIIQIDRFKLQKSSSILGNNNAIQSFYFININYFAFLQLCRIKLQTSRKIS